MEYIAIDESDINPDHVTSPLESFQFVGALPCGAVLLQFHDPEYAEIVRLQNFSLLAHTERLTSDSHYRKWVEQVLERRAKIYRSAIDSNPTKRYFTYSLLIDDWRLEYRSFSTYSTRITPIRGSHAEILLMGTPRKTDRAKVYSVIDWVRNRLGPVEVEEDSLGLRLRIPMWDPVAMAALVVCTIRNKICKECSVSKPVN
jgi:hypothetical protein